MRLADANPHRRTRPVTTPQHLTSRLGPSTVFLALLPLVGGLIAFTSVPPLWLLLLTTAAVAVASVAAPPREEGARARRSLSGRCTPGFFALAAAAVALAPSIGPTAPGLHAMRAESHPGTYSRSVELTAAASSVAQARASKCNESTSYTNSSGNCVHRPETTGSAPSGASAQCTDGEYSLSQHRAGTCSGHGGVKQWL
jgi:Protein of unknown function (DUF3761)